MKIILVIDVAAEHGGALTILQQFIREYSSNKENKYIFLLSIPHFQDTDNISFVNFKWVKKSFLHRLFFDVFYVKTVIRKIRPDLIISLQNQAVAIKNIPQHVYFHNALPISDHVFSIRDDKKIWLYQNVIGKIYKASLKYASRIFVQAHWIKKAMASKWHIEEDRIVVKKPEIDRSFLQNKKINRQNSSFTLFYPANTCIYKNHGRLLQALKVIWDNAGIKNHPTLLLTGDAKKMKEKYEKDIDFQKYPIEFLGQLSKEQMIDIYSRSTLIFPSYLETVGLPLIEAKELGCDIIASDCEYVHEAIGQYENCLYFNPFDVESIAEKIKAYIEKRGGKA